MKLSKLHKKVQLFVSNVLTQVQEVIIEQPKKSRRKKPTLEEQFKDIPTRQVQVNTLSDEDKLCPICGSEMLAIGTEVIRKEIVYTPPKLECIEYVATTYACPKCKDTEEPQFIKDNGTPWTYVKTLDTKS